MADPLFTLPELDAYTQSTVPVATGTLVLALVTTLIRTEVGAATYDALIDVSMLKPVALDVARRMLLNPDGKRSRSRQIDDYTETDTYASETLIAAASLSGDERDRIRDALGLRTTGAFSIRPAAPVSCRPWPSRCC